MKNKTLKESLIKNEKIYEMGIFLQYVLLGALIISSICTIFINELLLLARIVLGLLLFVMGYNNYRTAESFVHFFENLDKAVEAPQVNTCFGLIKKRYFG